MMPGDVIVHNVNRTIVLIVLAIYHDLSVRHEWAEPSKSGLTLDGMSVGPYPVWWLQGFFEDA